MTDTDIEWTELQEVWNSPDRASDARVAALHQAVRDQAYRLKVVLAFELLLTLAALAFMIYVWQKAPGPRSAVIIGFSLLHTAVIWAYAMWNRSGHWKPVAETVRDAVRVRRSHYRRRLSAYRFVTWLSAVEGALLVAVLVFAEMTPLPIVFALVWLALAVLWTVWDGGRIHRELDALDRFAQEFETE